jgi:hypothetical protein
MHGTDYDANQKYKFHITCPDNSSKFTSGRLTGSSKKNLKLPMKNGIANSSKTTGVPKRPIEARVRPVLK